MDPAFSATIDFDAAADWLVESYEGYLAAYTDPYYINTIEPDERNFVDKEGKTTIVRAMSTLGFCRSMIKDGKPSVPVSDEIWAKFKETRAS
jgi:EthD domain